MESPGVDKEASATAGVGEPLVGMGMGVKAVSKSERHTSTKGEYGVG